MCVCVCALHIPEAGPSSDGRSVFYVRKSLVRKTWSAEFVLRTCCHHGYSLFTAVVCAVFSAPCKDVRVHALSRKSQSPKAMSRQQNMDFIYFYGTFSLKAERIQTLFEPDPTCRTQNPACSLCRRESCRKFVQKSVNKRRYWLIGRLVNWYLCCSVVIKTGSSIRKNR